MYKTILVHVDQSARAAQRIDLAARLAMQYEAHLVGTALTGLSPYVFPVGGFDPAMPTVVFPVDELRADADTALDAFEARAGAAGVTALERRRIDDEAGIGVSMQARYCDLVIVGQTSRDEFIPRLRSDFPEYVLLNCARPVLIVPATGIMDGIGNKVMVAWNGSADAVRAITSALSMLKNAAQVDLVVINAQAEGDLHGHIPGADMGLYLARHGVRVEVSAVEGVADVGEALLSHAADRGADLIVMGAYGHSRFRELFMGGATRTALRSSPLPLWMAH
ncbi:universal stress protein [Massilia scottii]|uniref:universal stress protein n=1 Tax=Massilia scottii TaxID=3057166 RepID=UPI0027968E9B|nr:universal stress protein [Massilia sp. CCM 9029]MDQ1831648.1 universal stress protein [Massilia sp. CCM 9029]